MPMSSFSQSRIAEMKEIDTKRGWSVGAAGLVQQPACVLVGVESMGRGAGPVPPWLTQIVPNLSSLYTLFIIVGHS